MHIYVYDDRAPSDGRSCLSKIDNAWPVISRTNMAPTVGRWLGVELLINDTVAPERDTAHEPKTKPPVVASDRTSRAG
ncbi:hypothetical protein EVAR_81929_1 [Eumeta japonica]|uniref:Uncharacterized protein n=1 Tax=Eumeta variegata TaxID=151549 RepID=A0A4C1UXM4_EUMVA|nr:hypothetical protein EVAR_81929_1 [Eumeta japonica]